MPRVRVDAYTLGGAGACALPLKRSAGTLSGTMISLTPDESRVLGVLVEKATTTPDQYPLTLNAVMNGANQRNNRDPIVSFDESRTLDAINGLRSKGLLVQVDTVGSRVPKYRHTAQEKLGVNAREMAIVAELLLRGPQTIGELRGRASRMHALESLEMARSVLEQLMGRPEPLVRQLPPMPGSRAERYAQILCPDLHPLMSAAGAAPAGSPAVVGSETAGSLSDRVQQLEAEVAKLRQAVRKLGQSLGEPDLLG